MLKILTITQEFWPISNYIDNTYTLLLHLKMTSTITKRNTYSRLNIIITSKYYIKEQCIWTHRNSVLEQNTVTPCRLHIQYEYVLHRCTNSCDDNNSIFKPYTRSTNIIWFTIKYTISSKSKSVQCLRSI